MPWQDVSTGLFVDWAAADPLAHIDPYLVWAAATDFVDYGGPPVGMVPALIELSSGRTGVDLRAAGGAEVTVPDAYSASRVCSVTIAPGFLPLMRTNPALGAMVERVELALPVAAPRSTPAAGVPVAPRREPGAGPLGRTVLGVIDDGCAFAHRSLRRGAAMPAQTRVAWLWDQNGGRPAFSVAGTTPADFGYGQEYTNSVMQGWMDRGTRGGVLDEDACYAAAGYHAMRRRATHGMHVLDLATGPVRPAARLDAVQRPAPAVASPAAPDLIFVQLPQAALADPSGGWLAANVTDGVRYILDRAGADASRIVVNLSYGSRVGPHDGSSVLESALIEMLAENPALEIVLPAGNFHADRAHAVLDVPGGTGTTAIEAFVPPGSELPVFIELWLPPDAPSVSVCVTPPTGSAQASGFVAAGRAMVWPALGRPACTVVYPTRSTLAAQGTCILVVMAPTGHRDGRRTAAPAGRWRLELQAPAAVTVHGYVARSDADFGMARLGGRPHFVPDEHYDPCRHLRAARDDPTTPASKLRRHGTLAWAAVHAPTDGSSSRLHLLGGYVYRELGPLPALGNLHAPYSSAGPARAAMPAGPRPGPDLSLPTDASPVQRGIRAAGTRSASTVTLVGTSSAAPQYARLLVEGGNKSPIAGRVDVAKFGRGRVRPP